MVDCPQFYSEYFASNWMTRKHRWASHLTQHVFTGGVIASSYAESSGAAQGKWLQSPRHSLVDILLSCLEKEDLDIKKEQKDLALISFKAESGVASDPPFVRSCRSLYSEHVTELVLAEVLDSVNYTAFIQDFSTVCAASEELLLPITVKRNIMTEKEKTVSVLMVSKDMVHIQGCTCPKITNCGHPCRHIFSACALISAQLSIHIHFKHLQHLFNPRWLMKKEVLFVGKNLEQVHAANAEDINFGDNAKNICDQDDQTFGAENTDTQTFGAENTDTQKCTASTNSNFAQQLTQPAPPQKTNSARVPRISCIKSRSCNTLSAWKPQQ